MRADLWRYCIIYIFGGLYADTDVRPIRSISDWDLYPFDSYQFIIGKEIR